MAFSLPGRADFEFMGERTISAWGQLLNLRPRPGLLSLASKERRAWPRFACDVPTTYRLTQAADEPGNPARVQNICPGGLNVLVDRPLERGMVVHLELPTPADEAPSTVLACAIHSMPRPLGGWLVGCAIVTELSDAELRAFGALRLRSPEFDQRRWVRFPCDLSASYRRIRRTERQRLPARVIDIAAGGVGLLASEPVACGTLLDLRVQGAPDQVALSTLACVVRLAPHPAGQWVLGCNFIRELSDRELEPLKTKAVSA